MRWSPADVVAGRRRARWSLVVTGLATLAPVVLLPLFFRFTPLTRPSLVDRLEQLAERAGTRVVGVYEWALGDKSRRANAALTGLGATRRILVSDTMLADYSDEEIEVVLAHELGHHVHHDIWRGIALESALILLGFAVDRRGAARGRVRGWAWRRRRPGRAAAAGADGRRGVAGADASRACAVAASRAPGRPVRAAADVEPVGVHLGDAPPRRAEPCRGAARHAWCDGSSTATRRSKSGWPSRARGRKTSSTTETRGH